MNRYLAVLALSCASAALGQERVPVLLITGANNHEWSWTAPSLRSILEESGRFDVTVTESPGEFLSDAKRLAPFRAFVLDYNGPRWGGDAESNFLSAVRGGVGVSVIHASNNAFPGWVEYEKLVALCWREGTGHGRFHAFDVHLTDRTHAITRGMPDLRRHPDELYHRLVPMHGVEYRVLATAHSSKESGGTGADEPMILVRAYGKGRVFHTPLGHVWKGVPKSRASHADPQFRHLVARGTEWAATGVVTLSARPPNFLAADEREQGFRLLFDGRTLAGWRGYKAEGPPGKGWVVRHGSLVVLPKVGGGDLVSEEQFGEFDLRFEWKVTKGANSGVMYRVKETEGATYQTGPEFQILDDAAKPGPLHSAGALYDLASPVGKKLRPAGSFNSGRIVLQSGRLRHYVNGVMVVDVAFPGGDWKDRVAKSKFKAWSGFGAHARGHIALQDHGGEVEYRSIRIRDFTPAAGAVPQDRR